MWFPSSIITFRDCSFPKFIGRRSIRLSANTWQKNGKVLFRFFPEREMWGKVIELLSLLVVKIVNLKDLEKRERERELQLLYMPSTTNENRSTEPYKDLINFYRKKLKKKYCIKQVKMKYNPYQTLHVY